MGKEGNDNGEMREATATYDGIIGMNESTIHYLPCSIAYDGTVSTTTKSLFYFCYSLYF